jgi:hypothetical protein
MNPKDPCCLPEAYVRPTMLSQSSLKNCAIERHLGIQIKPFGEILGEAEERSVLVRAFGGCVFGIRRVSAPQQEIIQE